MSHQQTTPAMIAKAGESSSTVVGRAPGPEGGAAADPQTTPEEVVGLLRQLIEEGNVTGARRLTEAAIRRFPDHPKIVLASRILAPPRVRSTDLAQPTVEAERQWLANPPAEALGKWVALVGAKVVGMADSIEELAEIVRASNLAQVPVVQHLAP